MKNRHPIARVIHHICPKVVLDKREKLTQETLQREMDDFKKADPEGFARFYKIYVEPHDK